MVVAEKTATREAVQRFLEQLCIGEKSKAAFARKCGVSQQNVQNWVKGQNIPDVEKLVEIADIYGKSLDEAVGREAPGLPADEAEILEVFRGLDRTGRRMLLATARSFRESGEFDA